LWSSRPRLRWLRLCERPLRRQTRDNSLLYTGASWSVRPLYDVSRCEASCHLSGGNRWRLPTVKIRLTWNDNTKTGPWFRNILSLTLAWSKWLVQSTIHKYEWFFSDKASSENHSLECLVYELPCWSATTSWNPKAGLLINFWRWTVFPTQEW
jgi:hypothetical protein